jgi:hypothetical protein
MCEATIGILVVLALVLGWAWYAGKLNGILPVSLQKSSFVGKLAHFPAMQNCLVFDSNHGRRQSRFNRCNYF